LPTTNTDTTTLALHVLTSAGFGKAYPFAGGLTELTHNHNFSYKDSLQTIMNNAFTTILLAALPIPSVFLSSSVKKVLNAVKEFKEYLVEMVEEEASRLHLDDKGEEKDNLMSVLVRASISEGQGKGRSGLSNEEIYGNLFIYSLAGHDTTANTLAYAVHIMATDSKLQEWVREELIDVFGDKDTDEDWAYEKAFPKLKRTLAFMVRLSYSSP
jgi:cytochrome P450